MGNTPCERAPANGKNVNFSTRGNYLNANDFSCYIYFKDTG